MSQIQRYLMASIVHLAAMAILALSLEILSPERYLLASIVHLAAMVILALSLKSLPYYIVPL